MEENLADQLSCPICFEIPESEIYQCKNGHTVCNRCSTQITECPQCRVELGSDKIRNRALEMILDGYKFDCPHKGIGCVEKVTRKELQRHVKECPYKTGGGGRPPLVTPKYAPSAPPLEQTMNALSLDVPSGSEERYSARKEPMTPGYSQERSRDYANPVAECDTDKLLEMLQTVLGSSGRNLNVHVSPSYSYSGISVGQNRGLSVNTRNGCISHKPGGNNGRRQITRNETITLNGSGDYVVTAENGGHLIISGSADATVYGNLQTINVSGGADVTINGNVEDTVTVSGAGDLKICGNVGGNICASGAGDITVKGRHYGNTQITGSASVNIDC